MNKNTIMLSIIVGIVLFLAYYAKANAATGLNLYGPPVECNITFVGYMGDSIFVIVNNCDFPDYDNQIYFYNYNNVDKINFFKAFMEARIHNDRIKLFINRRSDLIYGFQY